MSARDELIATLYISEARAIELYEKIKAEVRHEAAEEIRAWRDACKYDPHEIQYMAMTGSAGLIDPEVKS